MKNLPRRTSISRPRTPRGISRRLTDIAVLLILGLCALSCAPSDLEPVPGSDATTSDTTDSTTVDGADIDSNADVFEADDQFEDVAAILTANCADSGCHGDSPNGNFHIEGGTNADFLAVRDALEDVNTLSGTPLVAAGSKDESAIYIRITSDVGAMPPAPNEPLTDEQVSTITRWIDDGAEFE
jgi:uncharacterized membrane protein